MKITTDTNWTPDHVLDAGEYDIQRVAGRGRAYVYRGAEGTQDLDNSMELKEDGEVRRFTVNATDKGYLYGDGIEVVLYQIV